MENTSPNLLTLVEDLVLLKPPHWKAWARFRLQQRATVHHNSSLISACHVDHQATPESFDVLVEEDNASQKKKQQQLEFEA